MTNGTGPSNSNGHGPENENVKGNGTETVGKSRGNQRGSNKSKKEDFVEADDLNSRLSRGLRSKPFLECPIVSEEYFCFVTTTCLCSFPSR